MLCCSSFTWSGIKIEWLETYIDLVMYSWCRCKEIIFYISHCSMYYCERLEQSHPLLVIGSTMMKPSIVLRRRRKGIYYLAWLDDDLTWGGEHCGYVFKHVKKWSRFYNISISNLICVTRMFQSQSSNHNSNKEQHLLLNKETHFALIHCESNDPGHTLLIGKF